MDDPRLAALAAALAATPAHRYPRGEEGVFEAAVAAVLRPGPTLDVLLIERTSRAEDPWSGHVALPGGRREPGDQDLVTTAFRETAEEVGLALDPAVHLLGALDDVRPSTRRIPSLVIAPFVAVVQPGAVAVPDPSEVAGAFWAPVDELRDPAAVSEVTIVRDGLVATFPAIEYRGYQIWGLTLRILSRLFTLLP